MAIGFLTAFPMSLALMFGMTDVDAVLKSSLPSAEIFYQITQSKGIVTFMMCWVIIVYYSILVSRGRAVALPSSRPFNLGKAGYICNFLAPILVTIIGTFICFPPQLPVTVNNMNYTPVILAGLFGVIMGLWYTRGSKFTGPKIDWEGLGLTGCK
ncbi:MAG: hypothetical protein Q9182_004252 [Xanthomendoza sp. 2 TL-2023]